MKWIDRIRDEDGSERFRHPTLSSKVPLILSIQFCMEETADFS
jgi:hypothetical protein